jgi:hypothetical protein
MIVVYHFFRAAASLVAHPGDLAALARGESDIVAQRRAEMNAVVQFALRTLRDNSPVGSGRDPHAGQYRDSHTLFINGDDVKDLSSWQPGDEIEISNPVPYARILEIGDSRHRLPHHTYELTEQALQRKYRRYRSHRAQLYADPVRVAQLAGRSRQRSRRPPPAAIAWNASRLLIIKGLD